MKNNNDNDDDNNNNNNNNNNIIIQNIICCIIATLIFFDIFHIRNTDSKTSRFFLILLVDVSNLSPTAVGL